MDPCCISLGLAAGLGGRLYPENFNKGKERWVNMIFKAPLLDIVQALPAPTSASAAGQGQTLKSSFSLHSLDSTLYYQLSIYSKYAHNSAKSEDKDTKLSGYEPWGLPITSITRKPNPTSPTLICHDLS